MNGPFWYLKRCELFEKLSDAEAGQLNRRACVRRYQRGELVYAPSEHGLAVMVLATGRVKIYDLTPDGRETILAFMEEGELFGETAALDGQPHREFAAAVAESEVLAIPREEFIRLLESRSDLSLSVTRLVGLRRQRIEARLRNVLFLTSRERMLHVLVELFDAHGGKSSVGHTLRFALSHQDLAGLIGVTRETATLTLGRLQAEGLITVARRRLTAPDLARLRQAARQQLNQPRVVTNSTPAAL